MSLVEFTSLGGLPEPVAQVQARFRDETNDAQRLSLTIACFEVALKFAAAVAIKALWAQPGKSAEVAATVCERLEKPSLGDFAGFLRKCSDDLDKRGERVWSPHLKNIANHPSIDPLLALRNQRGHGAPLTNAQARAELERSLPKLVAFLKALPRSDHVRLWQVIERPIPIVLRVQGFASAALVTEVSIPPDIEVDGGQLAIENRAGGQWLSLHPLLISDCGAPTSPCRFLIFNDHKKHAATFLDYTSAEQVAFPIGEKIQLDFTTAFPRPSRGPEWFTSLIQQTTQRFAGRDADLERLSVFSTAVNTKRVLVVAGVPGMGKTTLLARWSEGRKVLRHFLREGDERNCAPAAVFLNLARQVAETYNLELGPIKESDTEGSRSEFLRLLNAVRPECKAPVVIIDGLDEAERVCLRNPKIASLLDSLPEPLDIPERSRWILSTRPEFRHDPRFAAKFGEDRAQVLEINRLPAPEIRALLRKWPHWPEIDSHPGTVKKVVECSEGSPLYLRMVAEELAAGNLAIAQLDSIPQGLNDFFLRIINAIEEGCQRSDKATLEKRIQQMRETLRQLVVGGTFTEKQYEEHERQERVRIRLAANPSAPDLLAILAVARAPLLLDDAIEILAEPRGTIERALHTIRSVVTEAADQQWTLFHGAFRAFLHERRPELLQEAEARITQWCLHYGEHERPYALRHVVAHLADALEPTEGEPEPRETADRLIQTLTDLVFVALRAEQDEISDLLGDYQRALSLWPNLSPAPLPASQGGRSTDDSWRREVVSEVLEGETNRHLDLGAGPILLALREHPDRVRGFGMMVSREPRFLTGAPIPEDWFPEPILREKNAGPEPTPAPRLPAADHLAEFQTFVDTSRHWLSLPEVDVSALAFNFRQDGRVAEAAERILQNRRGPWLRRVNRPASSSSSTAFTRVLPADVTCAVSADFAHFVTVSVQTSDKGSTSIEAKLFAMDTGREIGKASGVCTFPDSVWLSHLVPQIGGDRVVLGAVVAEFATGHVFALHKQDQVRAVALTPNGRMAALAIGGNHLRKERPFIQIWDLETRECVREFEDDDPEIHAVALSADGRLLAAGRHWEDFKVWDVALGECLLTFGLGSHVRATAITPDGRFAVCSAEEVVWLLDLADGCILRRIISDLGRISTVAITPDGRYLAAVDGDLRLRRWATKSGTCTAAISVPASSSHLSLSADGNVAIVGTHVIDLRAVTAGDAEPHPIGAGLTQDGTMMACGREDGSLALAKFGESENRVIFRRSELEPNYEEYPREPAHRPVAVAFDRDGERSIFAFADGRLYSITSATGDAREIIPRQELDRLVAEELPIAQRDASRLRGENSLSPDVRAALADRRRTHYSFSQVVLIPDGKSVITAHHGDALRLWDIESGQCRAHLPMRRYSNFSEGEVLSLKPLPDNSGVVFTTADCALYRWSFSVGEKVALRSPPGMGLPAALTAVSPCGNLVIWAAAWQPMEIRKIADGQLVGSFPQRLAYVQFAEWCSEDGIAIVVDNEPYGTSLEVWDTRSYARISKYPLSGRANVLLTSVSARRLVCCTEEGQTHALAFEDGSFIS